MALYASDGDSYIFARDAAPNGSYSCLECSLPVKPRRSKCRVPHFYHLKKSPQCHLYSKSEDHLILQLQIQKILADETALIEHRLPSIHRIGDLIWEKERIVFEIQCSPISISEAQSRMTDYGKIGYRIVWLLDDRIFNRRFVRPVEQFLRSQSCYFFTFNRSVLSYFYDQMEIVIKNKRLRKGAPLWIDLAKPYAKPFLEWPHNLPNQIQERIVRIDRYFRGDIIYRMFQAAHQPSIACNFEKWRKLEIELKKVNHSPGKISVFFKHHFTRRYIQILDWLIDRINE